ncbi:hypothetical protein ACQWKP_22900, partial [Salmonella enterica subsp. enterica serovar Infantis]
KHLIYSTFCFYFATCLLSGSIIYLKQPPPVLINQKIINVKFKKVFVRGNLPPAKKNLGKTKKNSKRATKKKLFKEGPQTRKQPKRRKTKARRESSAPPTRGYLKNPKEKKKAA